MWWLHYSIRLKFEKQTFSQIKKMLNKKLKSISFEIIQFEIKCLNDKGGLGKLLQAMLSFEQLVFQGETCYGVESVNYKSIRVTMIFINSEWWNS